MLRLFCVDFHLAFHMHEELLQSNDLCSIGSVFFSSIILKHFSGKARLLAAIIAEATCYFYYMLNETEPQVHLAGIITKLLEGETALTASIVPTGWLGLSSNSYKVR